MWTQFLIDKKEQLFKNIYLSLIFFTLCPPLIAVWTNRKDIKNAILYCIVWSREKWKGTLKPVGHQSTNWMVLETLIAAMAAFTSFGTTSPRYSRQTAMYFPSEQRRIMLSSWALRHRGTEGKQLCIFLAKQIRIMLSSWALRHRGTEGKQPRIFLAEQRRLILSSSAPPHLGTEANSHVFS